MWGWGAPSGSAFASESAILRTQRVPAAAAVRRQRIAHELFDMGIRARGFH
jgi:hypothetical protein